MLLKPWMPRAGGWREDELQKPGTYVPADVTSRWPLQNRLALHKNGYIQFFETAREAEQIVGHEAEVEAAVRASLPQVQASQADARDAARNAALAKARAAKKAKRLSGLQLADLMPQNGAAVGAASA